MPFIKNAVLKRDDWDAEGFYETKADGFVAAVVIYECTDGVERAIMFKDRVAFMIYDHDTKAPATRDELQKALWQIVKLEGADAKMQDFFPDAYIEVCDGAVCDEDIKEMYHLDDTICADIKDRIQDLNGYYVFEEHSAVDIDID